jgi:cell division protein FtsL
VATARRRVAGGVVWIVVVALLLAGVVAVNVAVLRLNLRMDDLNRQRAQLRSDNEALSSKLASASSVGRTELLARQQLGLVPADPASTLYIDLRR